MKFHHWPLLCTLNSVICMAKWEISCFFLVKFGSLAIKVIAFWEISLLALLHTQNGVLCMVKCEISIIFPIGLAHWL